MRLLPMLIALAVVATACRHRPEVVQARVAYLGHDDAVNPPRRVPTKRVFIAVENRRGDAEKIGEDDNMHVPITASFGAITQMVDAGFRTELARVGVRVAPNAQDCDVILHVGLNGLKVSEGATYSATFVAALEVSEAGGNALGGTTIEATGVRWGDDYSGEEVNAALNNALAQLIANALQDARLMQLLGGG
jgi:hypothetical protein